MYSIRDRILESVGFVVGTSAEFANFNKAEEIFRLCHCFTAHDGVDSKAEYQTSVESAPIPVATGFVATSRLINTPV
jgi:hypothetical protein